MSGISEQITECWFGVFLEISDKFSSNLTVFSYIILQCWLNILGSSIIILYDFEKHSGWVFLLESP